MFQDAPREGLATQDGTHHGPYVRGDDDIPRRPGLRVRDELWPDVHLGVAALQEVAYTLVVKPESLLLQCSAQLLTHRGPRVIGAAVPVRHALREVLVQPVGDLDALVGRCLCEAGQVYPLGLVGCLVLLPDDSPRGDHRTHQRSPEAKQAGIVSGSTLSLPYKLDALGRTGVTTR